MKKVLIMLLIGVMILAPMAQALTAKDKLARGTINLLTGWIEAPRNIYDTSVEENIAVGITVGTVQGIGMAVVRTGAGVYDIATFPFAIPENYEPVLIPEFVFEGENPITLPKIVDIYEEDVVVIND